MPVKNRKQSDVSSTQKYLKVAEIHDNTVILKDGELRAVLETSSLNFDLKSPEEQDGVVFSYQQFLNSLSFPIQILVRSRTLDISSYLQKMKVRSDENKDQIMKDQTMEYIDFISKLVEIADIMQKKFYVVVPFDPPTLKNQTFIDKFSGMINPVDSVAAYKRRKLEFTKNVKGLRTRVQEVMGGLQGMGLEVKELETNELVELFYNYYNPIISMQEKVSDVDALNFNMIEEAKEESDREEAEE